MKVFNITEAELQALEDIADDMDNTESEDFSLGFKEAVWTLKGLLEEPVMWDYEARQ